MNSDPIVKPMNAEEAEAQERLLRRINARMKAIPRMKWTFVDADTPMTSVPDETPPAVLVEEKEPTRREKAKSRRRHKSKKVQQ